MANDRQVLLEVKNLTRYFPVGRGKRVHAVDHVSFQLERGRTLGLVGESGYGRSTTVRTIIRIYEPTEGHIISDEQDISHLSERELHPVWEHIQMIFQDPCASLNARMTVRDILAEPLFVHKLVRSKEEARGFIYPILEKVELTREHAGRYAHEFSGGQRQYVGIVRALILKPELIICGELISALDVSTQAQIINLLRDYQEESGAAYLLIAHDLSMVRYVSDKIDVIYLRQLVELYGVEEIYAHLLHPYTQGLLDAMPVTSPELTRQKVKSSIEGDMPSPIHPPSACRLRTRCPFAIKKCKEEKPALKDMGGGHLHTCHLYD